MAEMPPCKDDLGHAWYPAEQGITAKIYRAELCNRCAAIRFRVKGENGWRYARTPRWSTPDDLHRGREEALLDLVTPAPVPETAAEAYARERREWRQRMGAMQGRGVPPEVTQ